MKEDPRRILEDPSPRGDPHPEASSKLRIIKRVVVGSPPRDVLHLGSVDVWKQTRLSTSRHIAENVDSIVRHAQVGVNPVPSCIFTYIPTQKKRVLVSLVADCIVKTLSSTLVSTTLYPRF